MRKFTKKGKARAKLEEELNVAIDELMAIGARNDEEYTAALRRVEKLNALLGEKEPSKGISTWIPVIVALISLAEIVMIINYEQVGAITSKAFGRVPRGRV